MTMKLAAKGSHAAILLAIVTQVVCCAPPSQTDALHSSTPTSDVLTAEELATVADLDLLDAVRRVRPRWLRQRGVNVVRSRPIIVYLGDVYLGLMDSLRDIPIEQVLEMRFYDRYAANVRWGRDDVAGVIQVIVSR